MWEEQERKEAGRGAAVCGRCSRKKQNKKTGGGKETTPGTPGRKPEERSGNKAGADARGKGGRSRGGKRRPKTGEAHWAQHETRGTTEQEPEGRLMRRGGGRAQGRREPTGEAERPAREDKKKENTGTQQKAGQTGRGGGEEREEENARRAAGEGGSKRTGGEARTSTKSHGRNQKLRNRPRRESRRRQEGQAGRGEPGW